MAKSTSKGSDIQKRTPLEQAIAEKKDRRVRYEQRKKRQGFHKTNVWVKVEKLDEFRAFVEKLNATP